MSVTIDRNALNAPMPMAFAANRRSEADFVHARRHSWLVFGLKGLLPVCVALVAGTFAFAALWSYVPISGLSIGSASLKDGKLVMEDPKMAGFDRQNRPYDVRALRATQNLTQTEIVDLEKIVAQIPVDEKSFATVNALHGIYHTENETLALRDDITVKGARGMDIELETADINMRTGDMVSKRPVRVFSDRAVITADSVKVEDSGKIIIFENRVRTIVTQPVQPDKGEASDGEPGK